MKKKKTAGSPRSGTKAPAEPTTKGTPKKTARATPKKVGKGKKKTSPAPTQRRAESRPQPASRKAERTKRPTPPRRGRTPSAGIQEDISSALVLGASGCVGSFLVSHLLRSGYRVTAVDASERDIPLASPRKALTVRAGVLEDREFRRSCLESVDAIFHTFSAGHTIASGTDEAIASLGALRNFYVEARKRGVKRFVHVSSGTIYKRLNPPLTEQTPLEVHNEFEQFLLDVERVLLGEAGPGLPLVTVLRPPAVYGPRCRTQMASVAALPPLVKSLGPYYIQLSGGPQLNLAHAEDVARAAVFLLTNPRAFGEAFNVADNDARPFGDFVNEAMEAYGLKPLGSGIPYPPSTLLQSILPYVSKDEIFSPLGKLGGLLWQRLVRRHKLAGSLLPRIDPKALSFGSRDLVLDNHKLLDLGFKLKYPRFSKGWAKTQEWYLKHRWIPRPEEL